MTNTLSVAEQAEQEGAWSQAQQNKLRRKARELAKQSDDIFMELGKILYIIWDKTVSGQRDGLALFEKWGFASFADFVEQDLRMDRRRAQRLRKVWHTLEVECHGISDELKAKLVDMGPTKLRELSRVMNADNAQYWYTKCKDLTVKETTEAVNEHFDELHAKDESVKATDDDEEAPVVEEPDEDADPEATFNENFKLFPPQQRNLFDAIEAARHLSGNAKAKKGHCLDIICMDFLAGNHFTLGREDDREVYIAKMERNLRLKLIAIDPKTGEIIHGMETLEALSQREIEE